MINAFPVLRSGRQNILDNSQRTSLFFKLYSFNWLGYTCLYRLFNNIVPTTVATCFRIEVLLRVNEQRNILHEIRNRKANWIGHILRRNCLLQQVIEGKIKGQLEVTRR